MDRNSDRDRDRDRDRTLLCSYCISFIVVLFLLSYYSVYCTLLLRTFKLEPDRTHLFPTSFSVAFSISRLNFLRKYLDMSDTW
jgi:hypothetical protein